MEVALTRNVSLIAEKNCFLWKKMVVLLSVEWAALMNIKWGQDWQHWLGFTHCVKAGFCQANNLVWTSFVLLSSTYAGSVYVVKCKWEWCKISYCIFANNFSVYTCVKQNFVFVTACHNLVVIVNVFVSNRCIMSV